MTHESSTIIYVFLLVTSIALIRLLKESVTHKILMNTALEIYFQFSICTRESKMVKYFVLV